MRVRPGGPEDVEAVVALVAAVDRERDEPFDEPAFRAVLAEAVLFVAEEEEEEEEEGRIVGNLGLNRREGGVASLGMSVAAGSRRRGVGTALIESAIGWARGERLDRLVLEVRVDNEPALGLYRKLGFVEDRRRASGRGDVVEMTRRIESA